MEKHKSNALEKDCLCSGCAFRFQCFTQERLFSDPILQGLFEALMAQGMSKEDALNEVTIEIRYRITKRGPDGNISIIPTIFPQITPDTQPYVAPWVGDTITFQDTDGKLQVNYTMHDGKEVNWQCR